MKQKLKGIGQRLCLKKHILFILLALIWMGTFEAFASAEGILLWSSSGGFGPASRCEVVQTDDTAFRIVQYTGRGEQEYENIRTYQGARKNYLLNKSLVRFKQARERRDYRYIQVVGSSQNPGVYTNRWYANTLTDEVYEGYIYEDSFRSVSEYILQVKEGAPADLIGQQALIGTIWQARMVGSKFVSLRCQDEENEDLRPLVFDVFLPGSETAIAAVAVDPTDANILRSIRSFTLDEAQVHFAGEAASSESSQNASQQEGGGTQNVSLPLPRPDNREDLPESQDTSLARTLEESDDQQPGPHVDPHYSPRGYQDPHMTRDELEAAHGEETEEVEEPGESALHDEEGEEVGTSEEVTLDDVPVFDSNLEYVVCIDSETLYVRPHGSTSDVLFEARKHERVIPYQGFGEDFSFEATVNGQEYTFIRVEFPGRENESERMGWVAQDFVVPTTLCPGYQRALGDNQPVICTESDGLNVRGEDLNPDEVEFVAQQFEPVALRSDVDDLARPVEIGGQTYNMVPVVFPERNNQEGWVAREFVQIKAQCEPYKRLGECCIFPTHQRPTQSYTNPGIMTAYGYRRDGGRRRHAGCDLYRHRGDPAVAVAAGTVIQGPYDFYSGTFAVEVRHEDFVIRYGEILSRRAAGIRARASVTGGQTVGYIAQIRTRRGTLLNPMLHFEMYSGRARGPLTVKGRAGGRYQRRSDLLNPTEDLRQWERRTFGRSY